MAYFGKFYSSKSPVASSMGTINGRQHRGDVWIPDADIYETEEGVAVLVDLPGVAVEDVELHVQGQVLTVRGTRREECPHTKKCYRQMELRHGPFERVLELPCAVRRGDARLDGGVLEIFLPRAKRKSDGVLILHVAI